MKNSSNPFEIIFKSDHLIVINKPYGYFVHQTSLDPYASDLVMPKLRDQIQQKVYPVHRLDRKTTGVLIFALNPETQRELNKLFQNKDINKTYISLVRGWVDEVGRIDYELTNLANKTQEAITEYKCLEKYEIPISSDRYPTSRYSLVELKPLTGRYHQLRKHMAHIRHPIIGDRPHGCNKQNRFFKERFNYTEMMLHASNMSFEYHEKSYNFEAPFSYEFEKLRAVIVSLDCLK